MAEALNPDSPGPLYRPIVVEMDAQYLSDETSLSLHSLGSRVVPEARAEERSRQNEQFHSSRSIGNHPAFLRLPEIEKTRMMKASELWEAPAGARLFHTGDSGEELLLLLEGRLESDGGNGYPKRWLPGDLWGEGNLVQPRPVEYPLTAAESSRWLRWSRQTLLSLASSSSGLRKSLSPLRDTDGRLISGFSEDLPVTTGSGRFRRRIRPSVRPAAVGLVLALLGAGLLFLAAASSENLPKLLPLAVPAVFAGWLLVFLLKRMTVEYAINTDSITSKAFDWGHFATESRHVPIDRVQGVETERNGLIRRLLGIGTVIVKTSALDGELTLRDVLAPESLRKKIMEYQKNVSERSKGRDREVMRRTLEANGLGERVPRKISGSGYRQDSGSTGTDEIRFHKSLAVLFGRLILPVLIALIPILGVNVFAGLIPLSSNLIVAFALLPVLWALYRFEDWRNDSFLVSGGYAVDLYRKPLGLKESRRQVELASVQNIRTEQKGFLPFLFRFGNVILVTAGGAADTVFENVSRPWKVQETLFHYREDDIRRREASRREQRKDDLTRFAEALDQIRGTSEPSSLSRVHPPADYRRDENDASI